MTDLEPEDLGFAGDTRYSRFHLYDSEVNKWSYHGERWMVSGHAAVIEAARDTASFSSRHDVDSEEASPYLGVMVPATPIRAVPVELDPPLYGDYRKLLASRFTPPMVRKIQVHVEDFVTWCVDEKITTGRMDLFHDLSKLVPALTTMSMIGLPTENAELIANAVHTRGEDRFQLNPAWTILIKITIDTIKARRADRRDDLISYLIQTPLAGHSLEDHEILGICFTMVIGGMASTARLTLGALSYFAVKPQVRQQVMDDPALLNSAIEEFLRYYSPVPFLSRTATRDVSLSGQQIQQGDRVALGYAAANRDPRVFDRPDRIILDRSPNRHVALGHGTHYCIGANLGRMEASLMIREVLTRLPDFQFLEAAGEPLTGCPMGAPREESARPDGMTWEERSERGVPVSFTPGERSGRDLGHIEIRRVPWARIGPGGATTTTSPPRTSQTGG